MSPSAYETIEYVVAHGLCTGCGTCAGVCPQDALRLVIDPSKRTYLPTLDKEKCTLCGLCVRACPGHAVDFKDLRLKIFGREPENPQLGNYLECFMGHASDPDIRHNSASGGLATALLVYALEHDVIDGALVTRMRSGSPLEPEPFIARTSEELIQASKSKYCPVPANVALREVLNSLPGQRFAIVGVPCHIEGLRKASELIPKLKEKIVFTIGLACSHTDTFAGTEFILWREGISPVEVVKIDYRGHGWPGSLRVLKNDGGEQKIPYRHYIQPHKLRFFSPARCNLCADFLASFADVVLMDAWLPEVVQKDSNGTSLAIARTERGSALCHDAAARGCVTLDQADYNTILRSQGRARANNSDLAATFRLSQTRRRRLPEYGLELPRPRPTNYARVLLGEANTLLGSRRFLWPVVRLMLVAEMRLLH